MAIQRTPQVELVAVEPVQTGQPPRRFAPWPDDIKERCYELWGTVGNRNASRVEWLLSRELPEGTAVPAAVTVRSWASAEDWEARADGDLTRTSGRTLRQLQTTWLRALQLSQEVQIDALLGKYDDNPAAGAVRLKAAESVQKVVVQAGLLALVPPSAPPQDEDLSHLSPRDEARMLRERMLQEKQGHG